jgi:hypothetical protein
MCLSPFFSVTPNAPYAYTYDANQPQAAYAYAALLTFGGFTVHGAPHGLSEQFANNAIAVGYDAVLPADVVMTKFDDISQRCGLWLNVIGYNVDATNQFLVVFRLKGLDQASAQFFIGYDYLESHPLTITEGRHAILIDCPGDGIAINLFVRLESPEAWHHMEILGVECCLV